MGVMYNLYIMNPASHSASQATQLARTQVYLTAAQQVALAQESRRASVTKSELIRQAISQFLEARQAASPEAKASGIAALAGLWQDRQTISDPMADPAAYVRQLRARRF